MTERPEEKPAITLSCDARAAPCDVAVVEVLLRLKLAALRAGCPVRMHASKELLELIAFMGLDDVLAE